MKNPRGSIFAHLGHLPRTDRLAVLTYITCREITSTNDLTPAELETVAGALFSWSASGHLDLNLAEILGRAA
jgi:hypothetical protein